MHPHTSWPLDRRGISCAAAMLVFVATVLGAQAGPADSSLANKRALGATGKAPALNSNAGVFWGSGTGTKLILPDLAGRQRTGASTVSQPAAGLGGTLIEIEPGTISALVKTSSLIPDDPTANSTTERLADTGSVQLSVTPRWHLARSS